MTNRVYIVVLENSAWGNLIDIVGVFTSKARAKKIKDNYETGNLKHVVVIYETDFYSSATKVETKEG